MDIQEHNKRYWKYEYDVTAHYMVPLLAEWGSDVAGTRVLDVGCGEGGGLCAMRDAGARSCGFDIDTIRIELAGHLQGARDIPFLVGNMYEEDRPFAGQKFDIVMLHDVYEHLEDKDTTLRRLADYLDVNGKMMITFPPYYSAFGAHQQLLSTQLLHLPFVHLLPFVVTRLLPRLRNESPTVVAEIQKLARLKMGMHGFENIVRRNNLRIVGKQAYIISPNHIRFGLTPIPAGLLARVPILSEVICSGVAYLLSKETP